ncbi:RyR domain-containing protein [Planotetraspora kaengkrachanensis]|uniref:RCK N-terminal domain-containing protein n=1 Tax=Planotetraspora kaengkrachanensis TaxID=575193 RepID=A0A8J3M083_9ACTN|nr:RyR domain-containing protein [Planotetraspora kaengkrachanensis]GIG79678.1 hypothetical protein Pka01_28050 [Planotetraspora kaengkrachanensis]
MTFSATFVVRVTFVFLGLAALAAGYIGLAAYAPDIGGLPPTRLDLLYWDLQLFVFDSAPLEGNGPLPGALEFARFAAPGVTVYTLVEGARLLLSSEMRRIRARESRDHVVVCGSGAVAIALVEKLRRTSERIVMIGSSSTPPMGDGRVLYVNGDARSPSTLRAAGVHRASVLYACEADSSVNTAIALAAHGMPRIGERHPLSAYAHISDPDLCAALRARRLGLPGTPRLRLDFFNLDELAARVLLEQHPIVNDRPIVVIGLDAFGRSLLTEIARRRRLQGSDAPRLPVTLIDTHASQAAPALCHRFEFIGEVCALTCHDVAPSDLPLTDLLPGETPQRVFICYADQDLALKTALTSLRLWCCGPGSLVVRVEQTATFGSAFDDVRLLEGLSGALRIFAINEAAGDPRLITEDLVETLARAIHENYLIVNTARNTSAANASMVGWDALPPRLKAANRGQAEDIGRKLAAIGCALAPRVEPDLEFAFKDHEIERLSQMEHERWLKNLIRNGWTWGPIRDAERRRHPDLDSWDRLSAEAREKDRDTVRSLPGILADAGFQIVRIS